MNCYLKRLSFVFESDLIIAGGNKDPILTINIDLRPVWQLEFPDKWLVVQVDLPRDLLA